MSFYLAHGKALFLAGLTLAVGLPALAQTNGAGQQIVFSTPEGQVGSNSTVPLTQAPAPQELGDMPVEAPETSFSVHGPQMPLPAPAPMILPQGNPISSGSIDPMDPMNPRNVLKSPTAAQIMGVRTARQIFGLPDSSTENNLKSPMLAFTANEYTGTTNIISSDTSSSEDPTWAKILAANEEQNTPDSTNTTAKSHGLLESFFNGPPSDDSFFGNQDKNVASDFGPSQPNAAASSSSSSFDSSLGGSTFGNSLPTPSAPETTMNSGFTPPSIFSPPQGSSLGSLPQLPTPPMPGQNFTPPPPPPSWEAKPPPWLSTTPSPGTMQLPPNRFQ